MAIASHVSSSSSVTALVLSWGTDESGVVVVGVFGIDLSSCQGGVDWKEYVEGVLRGVRCDWVAMDSGGVRGGRGRGLRWMRVQRVRTC